MLHNTTLHKRTVNCSKPSSLSSTPTPFPILTLTVIEAQKGEGDSEADITGGKETQVIFHQCRLTFILSMADKSIVGKMPGEN